MKTMLVDAVYCYVVETENGDFTIDKEMHDLLESYPNPKIVLTGADDESWQKYNLDQVKDYPVFTLKHNPEKTNPEYYRTLLKQYDLDPGECIYFEHNIEAVKSAQSIGIESYHYDNNKKDLINLKKFLDQNL